MRGRNFAVYRDGDYLAGLCRDLMSEQIKDWPQLRENCGALKGVRTRTIDCGGYEVRLQCNPKRMASTAARLDESVRQACFLCDGNRPGLQKGILYRDRYMVLCNPMPIFEHHYTVACTDHVPQALNGTVSDLLLLSRDMGADFAIFYNGARCGASAPDHLHFQACPSYNFFRQEEYLPEDPVRREGGVEIFNLEGIGRGAAVMNGNHPGELERSVRKFMTAAKEIIPGEGEPMVNVVSIYRQESWRLVLYPRLKHRPDVYYGRNGRTILVSPGAVDMSGLMILPREDDFEKVNEKDIRNIYEETGAGSRTVGKIIESMQNALRY